MKLTMVSVIVKGVRFTGFVVTPRYLDSFDQETADELAKFPGSAATFLIDGHPPALGTTIRNPDLAETLTRIRDQGADGFYEGRTADLIVAEMKRGGGLITKTDLERYRTIIESAFDLIAEFDSAPIGCIEHAVCGEEIQIRFLIGRDATAAHPDSRFARVRSEPVCVVVGRCHPRITGTKLQGCGVIAKDPALVRVRVRIPAVSHVKRVTSQCQS